MATTHQHGDDDQFVKVGRGHRYTKVAKLDAAGGRSAVAFIHKATGHWYDSASWTRPSSTRTPADVVEFIRARLTN